MSLEALRGRHPAVTQCSHTDTVMKPNRLALATILTSTLGLNGILTQSSQRRRDPYSKSLGMAGGM